MALHLIEIRWSGREWATVMIAFLAEYPITISHCCTGSQQYTVGLVVVIILRFKSVGRLSRCGNFRLYREVLFWLEVLHSYSFQYNLFGALF
jgi:hypothetical protein